MRNGPRRNGSSPLPFFCARISRIDCFPLFLGVTLACLSGFAAGQEGRPGLLPSELAIVVNDDDGNSVEVGEYYRRARAIPSGNIVHVRIPNRPHRLDATNFLVLKEQIDAHLGPQIEAVVMVWTAPYAVECNSITSAFSLGFDAAQCRKSCAPAKASPYFNSPSTHPMRDHGMRLSMLLPSDSVPLAKALIDRGMASGFMVPKASAYYLITSEAERNSRAQFFPPSGTLPQRKLTVHTIRADNIEGKRDIMIYQTGRAQVDKLDTLSFLPGALADHLTSAGGDLLGTTQMSSLRWIAAGATASYGAVSEPCNYWQKFPQPTVLLRHYLSGASAIEAYWKSVAWPAQGLFIGEPLAAPYRR
jgi:uncharacterized protein (TIGR03790 family)